MTRLNYDITGKRIYIAGHHGMIGQAIIRRLQQEDCTILTRTRRELDLLRQAPVTRWLKQAKPDVVIIAAGKSGGSRVHNDLPGDFLYENLMIATNLIQGAFEADVEKLLNISAPYIYPENPILPTPEHQLLMGKLAPAYENAAIAKLAALKLCQSYHQQFGADFTTIIPPEIYGPGDNFDLLSARTIPTIIRHIHDAKCEGRHIAKLPGHGTVVREFLYVDDCADAIITILEHHRRNSPINVGTSQSIPISTLAFMIADIVGFDGKVDFARQIPQGAAERNMQGNTIRMLGWSPAHSLEQGLVKTYDAFCNGYYRENKLKLVS
ncbi:MULTISPECIES: NAD-dependent epimerase/dehydratase family protein [Thalassospira]|uniref:GDP-L-fucose synthase n=1 Tax=Thalassospira aquimaris TaxID=3037796 RepID=A0ABT6GDG5_9PROT|nr:MULTISPECIES: NAD-dependent epimerase/dehydratase family protein [Thalassospira]MDG4720127.1 NAD-dependent epimerase/dehydratase family protein [Thalassospira sp. FZY0004]